MISISSDPLDDFRRQCELDHEAEERCPKCDNCGDVITPDEPRYEAHIHGHTYTLCKYCCGEVEG